MREDPDHYRNCRGCGKRYNAFQYGNYFYCSYACSAIRRAEVAKIERDQRIAEGWTPPEDDY